MADSERRPDISEPRTWRQLFDEVYEAHVAERGERAVTWSLDEVDYVLWEYTPFPMGSEDEVRAALVKFFRGEIVPYPGERVTGDGD